MRVNLAGLMLWELKFRVPNESAAASEVEVLVEEEALGEAVAGRFVVETLLGFCLRICKAFANAFS